MVNTKQIFVLFFIALWKQDQAADFAADSFVLQSRNGSKNYVFEYAIDGTFLQSIELPHSLSASAFKLDSTRSLLAVQTYISGFPYANLVHAINSHGKIVDTTTYSPGTDVVNDSVLDGQNVWISLVNYIKYIPRGGTQSTADISYSAAAFYTYMQLVGTRLYVRDGTTIKYLDPIMTSGTATPVTLSGAKPISYFSFLKHDVFYGINPITFDLVKFTLDSSKTTATLAYKTAVSSYFAGNVHPMEVAGNTYVFVLSKANSTASIIITRYRDNGSAFVESTVVVTADSGIGLIGPSPISHCLDGVLDEDETDIDCGGIYCSACANGKTCSIDKDCTNGYCNLNNCDTAVCNDTVKNGKESDVDCGGLVCNGCAIGQTCIVNSDCLGNFCDSGHCVPSCADTILNNGESDVDCGGVNCSACLDGKTCLSKSDCLSDYCNPTYNCSVPSCSDGFLNQDETDTDCGGTICNTCANDKSCVKDSDCESNTCTGNVCVNPPVAPVAPPVTPPISPPVSPPVTEPSPNVSVSAPINQNSVSAGTVLEASGIAFFVALTVFP